MKLLKFYSTSCGTCGRMSHYDNKVATELGLEFKSYKVNTEAFNSNSHLLDIVREERGRVGFPAYVVTDDDGNYKGNVMGGYEKGKFREALKQVLNGDTTFDSAPTPGGVDCPYYTLRCICDCRSSTDDSVSDQAFVPYIDSYLGGNEVGDLERIDEYEVKECSEAKCAGLNWCTKQTRDEMCRCECTDQDCTLVCYKKPDGPDPDPDPDPDPKPPGDPCEGVTCPECHECRDGNCVNLCGPDQICENGVCKDPDPCENVNCPDCHECVEGDCVNLCSENAICVDGACVDIPPTFPGNCNDSGNNCPTSLISFYYRDNKYGIVYDNEKIQTVWITGAGNPEEATIWIRFKPNICKVDCNSFCLPRQPQSAAGGYIYDANIECEVVEETLVKIQVQGKVLNVNPPAIVEGYFVPSSLRYECCFRDCEDIGQIPPYQEGDNGDCGNRPDPNPVPDADKRNTVYLYDRLNHTYVFCCPIRADVTWLLPFDTLPPVFQRYITTAASVRAAAQLIDNPQLFQLLKDREQMLRMECQNYELEQGDLNYLNQPDHTEYYSYQVIQTLNR